jgi:hypothetical protein
MQYMDTTIVAGIRGFLCVLALTSLAACKEDATTNPVTPEEPTDPQNAAPQISGAPTGEVTVGQAFNFVPSAADDDGDDLSFSISSKPSWASFNEETGRLWGTPDAGDVGSHEEIVITVSDGKATHSLPQFVVNVVQPSLSSVTLAWQAPTENTDGSALTNLKGYKIHYGTESGSYEKTITLDNAGLTRYVIEDLLPGTYFFAVTAVNQGGTESGLSGEADVTI